jgi:copper chaperone CopZ
MKKSQKHILSLRWQEWPAVSDGLDMAPGGRYMAQQVAADQWAVFSIVGMHCHRCEKAIQKQLGQIPGVHEAEVDFNSGQASVLYNPHMVSRPQLIEAIHEAGYQVREQPSL